MEETAPAWYILAGDHIRLDGEEFEVLDKSLTPLGGEVGFCFCFCTKKETSAERSWQLFRWNDEFTRIHY